MNQRIIVTIPICKSQEATFHGAAFFHRIFASRAMMVFCNEAHGWGRNRYM